MLLLVDKDSPPRTPRTAAQVLAAVQSWSMQVQIAFARISSEPSSSREFLKPTEEELRIRMAFSSAVLKRPRKVTFDRPMRAEILATASFASPGDYKITITVGTVVALFLGALALVDRETGCSSDLELTNERRRNKHVQNLERLWEPLVKAYEASPFAHLLPEEPWRIVLAHSIMGRSLDYLLGHELGHVMRGHLNYGLRWGTDPSFAEASGKSKGLPPEFSRIIESQADDHASLHSGAKWHHLSKNHDFNVGPLCSGTNGFAFFNAPDICRSVAHSIALLFFVLDYGSNSTLETIAQSSGAANYGPMRRYPPIGFRLWRALRLSRLGDVANSDWRQILGVVRDCLVRKGLIGATYLLPDAALESKLEAYNQELFNQGSEALQSEKDWVREGIDITQPPPVMPRKLWVWHLR